MSADDDGDAVGEPFCLVHVVRRQEDRLAEVAEVFDHVPGCSAGRGVEACGRLVEEDQFRVADQCEREVESAAFAARETRCLSVVLSFQSDERDRLDDGSRLAVVARVQLESFANCQAGVGRGFLQDDPDAVAPFTRPVSGINAEYRYLAARAGPESLEDLDGGRFAGSIWAEEGEDLAALDLEIDSSYGFDLSVALAQPEQA